MKHRTFYTDIVYDLSSGRCIIRSKNKESENKLKSSAVYDKLNNLLILSGRTFKLDFHSMKMIAYSHFHNMEYTMKKELFGFGAFNKFIKTLHTPDYVLKYIPLYGATDFIETPSRSEYGIKKIIEALPDVVRSDRWYIPQEPKGIMVIDIHFLNEDYRAKLIRKRINNESITKKFRTSLKKSLKEQCGIQRPNHTIVYFEDNVINSMFYYIKGMQREYVETVFSWTSEFNNTLPADNEIIEEIRSFGFNLLPDKTYDIKSNEILPLTFERNKLKVLNRLYDRVFSQIDNLNHLFSEHIRKQFIHICAQITGIVDERIKFPNEYMLHYLSIYKKHMSFFDLDYDQFIEQIFNIRMSLRLIASITQIKNETIELTDDQIKRLRELNALIHSMKSFIEKYVDSPDMVFLDMLDSINRSILITLPFYRKDTSDAKENIQRI
jgi:hypothetical protein